MKKILKFVLFLILSLVAVFGLFLLYATLTDYRPEEKIVLSESPSPESFSDSATISLITWNIGYAGLNKEMDFFYDGGEKVRPPADTVYRNILAIKSFVLGNDSIDFFLLQEVDQKAKRSYRTNQTDTLKKLFPSYHSGFGKNYDVRFVPTPPANPMGRVISGLFTLARKTPAKIVRHAYPGNFSFPTGLFMLDRCFMEFRYPVSNGRELVIINTHNSAFDDGELRRAQMKYLRAFLLEEATKNNYVIAGGDWNQCPPGFRGSFSKDRFDEKDYLPIEDNYIDGWKWVYDGATPSNRRTDVPYVQGLTATTVIDFFLISPNIEPLSVQTVDLGFKHSDHQPVILSVRLK